MLYLNSQQKKQKTFKIFQIQLTPLAELEMEQVGVKVETKCNKHKTFFPKEGFQVKLE